MSIWVVKTSKHLSPAWFTVSALSPQAPPLQRLPGSSPRTPGPCSGLSIKPFTPDTAESLGLPSLLSRSWPLSGGLRSCYIIGLSPLLQEPDPATEPSAATAPHFRIPSSHHSCSPAKAGGSDAEPGLQTGVRKVAGCGDPGKAATLSGALADTWGSCRAIACLAWSMGAGDAADPGGVAAEYPEPRLGQATLLLSPLRALGPRPYLVNKS